MDTKPSSEDILNAILPPREWVETGKHYIQYVSH
jgi:dynein light intermediate chain